MRNAELKVTSFLDYVTKNKTTTNSTVFQSGKITNTFRMARIQGGKYPVLNMKLATTKGQSASIYLGVFQLI